MLTSQEKEQLLDRFVEEVQRTEPAIAGAYFDGDVLVVEALTGATVDFGSGFCGVSVRVSRRDSLPIVG